ncbi:TPA: hypothetical protein DIV45_00750 [Patescibacteria group bacterium]|nr:hypothetical protein [Patescibacteria group bacterium]
MKKNKSFKKLTKNIKKNPVAILIVVFVILAIGLNYLPQIQQFFRANPSEAANLIGGGDPSSGGIPYSPSGGVFGPYPWKPTGEESPLIPVFSILGSRIYDNLIPYVKSMSGPNEVYIYDSDTGESSQLTEQGTHARNISVYSNFVVYISDDSHSKVILHNLTNNEKLTIFEESLYEIQVMDADIFGNIVAISTTNTSTHMGTIYIYKIDAGDLNTATEITDAYAVDLEIYNDNVVFSSSNFAYNKSVLYLYKISQNQLTTITPLNTTYNQSDPSIYKNYVVAIEQMPPGIGMGRVVLYNLSNGEKKQITKGSVLGKNDLFQDPYIYGNLIVWSGYGPSPSGTMQQYGNIWIYKLPSIIDRIIKTTDTFYLLSPGNYSQRRPIIYKNTVYWNDARAGQNIWAIYKYVLDNI